MKLGFSLPTAGAWATPENQIRVARQAETLGYHSLWVFQRLLYALDPKNEYPPVPGKTWPKPFERVLDPIVTLAYVAAATSRIRLGTSVLIMPFYTPVVLAKQLATLDVLSGGAARRRAGPRLVGGRVRGGRSAVQGARAARRRVPPLPRHDLDPGRDRVPRRVLSRAPLPGGAQAGAEAAPADHHRRLRQHGGEARGRAGRRVQWRQRADGQRGPAGARGPGGGGRARQGSGTAPHRLPRLLPSTRYAAGPRPSAVVGHARRDPRGHRPLRGRRPHRAVPRGQLHAGRAVARADPRGDDTPRPRGLGRARSPRLRELWTAPPPHGSPDSAAARAVVAIPYQAARPHGIRATRDCRHSQEYIQAVEIYIFITVSPLTVGSNPWHPACPALVRCRRTTHSREAEKREPEQGGAKRTDRASSRAGG